MEDFLLRIIVAKCSCSFCPNPANGPEWSGGLNWWCFNRRYIQGRIKGGKVGPCTPKYKLYVYYVPRPDSKEWYKPIVWTQIMVTTDGNKMYQNWQNVTFPGIKFLDFLGGEELLRFNRRLSFVYGACADRGWS